MRTNKEDNRYWERVLFHPPAWPFASDDPEAPAGWPGCSEYGYNIQELDSLPMQNGYSRLSNAENTQMSTEEAENYYRQYELFRSIMTDEQWVDRHVEDDLGEARASSTESSRTAVSEQEVEGSSNPDDESESHGLGEEPWGRMFALLRFPLVLIALGIIIVELFAYVFVRLLVRLHDRLLVWRGRRCRALAQLNAAGSYAEYLAAAQKLDELLSKSQHKWRGYLDEPLLRRLTTKMRDARERVEQAKVGESREAIVGLCDLLLGGALRANAGGWENRQAWAHSYSQPPVAVERYVDELVRCLDFVRKSLGLSADERQAFFRHAARQQGRTALCLSGGAAMGWKHLGVARALLDDARLPRVISGASAGAVVAALLGTHTDDELRMILRPALSKYMTACQGSATLRVLNWLRLGHCFDAISWVPRAQVFTRGNLTFREAFERTGKVLSISCTPMGHRYAAPRLLNYVTAPDVIIWSAVLASACLPGVLQPMVLLMKTRSGRVCPYTACGLRWRDGSFRCDIPSAELRATFNVRSTVVSQVNPHINLFFFNRNGAIGQPVTPSFSRLARWRGGFVLSALEHFLKLDIRKHLRMLSDLNLLPLLFRQDWSFVWLQKFDGNVTILPEWRVSELWKLISDPTEKSLAQSIRVGQAATWPKLALIRARQRIEDAVASGWAEAAEGECLVDKPEYKESSQNFHTYLPENTTKPGARHTCNILGSSSLGRAVRSLVESTHVESLWRESISVENVWTG
ncbi:hypothetical protein GGI07_002006 [Coemansia sp. Benny D115]|nr:hypothetical protein GGI07_002006 [Coemansia sp. Benny D115]